LANYKFKMKSGPSRRVGRTTVVEGSHMIEVLVIECDVWDSLNHLVVYVFN